MTRSKRAAAGSIATALALAALASFAAPGAMAQGQLCDSPDGYCTPMVQPVCIERLLGAGATAIPASTADCGAQRRSYMACIQSAAQLCSPQAEPEEPELQRSGGCSPQDARELWTELRESTFVDDLDGFAEMCKGSPQAMLAANRAKRLRESLAGGDAADEELSGWPVVEAQAHLARLGLSRGDPTGEWDGPSRAALAEFQGRVGLPEDGRLTGATLTALRERPTPAKDSRIASLEGGWVGAYRYDDPRPSVGFTLRLDQRGVEVTGRSDEPQTFGAPGAGMLHADWVGRISSDGLLAFVKTYDGTGGQNHSIRYTGRLVAPDRIEGRWSVNPQVNGSFTLTRR